MAKKEETISMIDTLAEFKELKNIDKDTMISVLEDSFRNVIAKMFGTDENYDVIINPEKGDFEIWRNRAVVADDDAFLVLRHEGGVDLRHVRSARNAHRMALRKRKLVGKLLVSVGVVTVVLAESVLDVLA